MAAKEEIEVVSVFAKKTSFCSRLLFLQFADRASVAEMRPNATM